MFSRPPATPETQKARYLRSSRWRGEDAVAPRGRRRIDRSIGAGEGEREREDGEARDWMTSAVIKLNERMGDGMLRWKRGLDSEHAFMKREVLLHTYMQYIQHSSYLGRKCWCSANSAIPRARVLAAELRFYVVSIAQGDAASPSPPPYERRHPRGLSCGYKADLPPVGTTPPRQILSLVLLSLWRQDAHAQNTCTYTHNTRLRQVHIDCLNRRMGK